MRTNPEAKLRLRELMQANNPKPLHPSQQPKEPEGWTSLSIYCFISKMKCNGCLKAKLGYDPKRKDEYFCPVPWEVTRALKLAGHPSQAPQSTKEAAGKLLLEAGIQAQRKEG